MTRNELTATALRFQKMNEYFKKLIETDPQNASFYQIFIDHYRHQSVALHRTLEEMEVERVPHK